MSLTCSAMVAGLEAGTGLARSFRESGCALIWLDCIAARAASYVIRPPHLKHPPTPCSPNPLPRSTGREFVCMDQKIGRCKAYVGIIIVTRNHRFICVHGLRLRSFLSKSLLCLSPIVPDLHVYPWPLQGRKLCEFTLF
jgi:hypothetical protein